MRTINRTLLIVVPKQPFFDWVKSIEGDSESIPESEYRSAYLIPDKYDETDYKTYLRKHFKAIFEEELVSEFTDIDLWPSKRDYKTFVSWFEVQAYDMVHDLCNEPLETEEFE